MVYGYGLYFTGSSRIEGVLFVRGNGISHFITFGTFLKRCVIMTLERRPSIRQACLKIENRRRTSRQLSVAIPMKGQ
jgi:hypothetical protein